MAAVFASIAAIAVGTGGGGSLDSIQDLSPGEMIGKFTDSPSNILSDLRERPEPVNPVKINAELDKSTELKLDSERLVLEEFEKIVSERRNISSDRRTEFFDFSGRLVFQPENLTEIRGTVSGFSSSGVTFSQNMNLKAATDAEKVKIQNVERERINVKSSSLRIESLNGSTVIEKEDTNLKINSFSGDVTYHSENSSLAFRGDVSTVDAGGTSFSG